MKPAFRILADQNDVTDKVRDRLLSVRVTDEVGLCSDAVEIRLDDREGALVLPELGSRLEVSLGYVSQQLVPMGVYTVDELRMSGPPQTLAVRAQAADLVEGTLQSSRTLDWEDVALPDLVARIAADHGYRPRVDEAFSQIVVRRLDQVDESDMHLLTRLGRTYGAVAKPAGGYLLFVSAKAGKSAGGADVETVELRPCDVSSWRATRAERRRYRAVVAHWQDTSAAARVAVRVGEESGGPVRSLRETFADEEQARTVAAARLKAAGRALKVSLTLPGDPRLAAETPLRLSGFRTEVDGIYVVHRAEHELSGSGYRTRLEADRTLEETTANGERP